MCSTSPPRLSLSILVAIVMSLAARAAIPIEVEKAYQAKAPEHLEIEVTGVSARPPRTRTQGEG